MRRTDISCTHTRREREREKEREASFFQKRVWEQKSLLGFDTRTEARSSHLPNHDGNKIFWARKRDSPNDRTEGEESRGSALFQVVNMLYLAW